MSFLKTSLDYDTPAQMFREISAAAEEQRRREQMHQMERFAIPEAYLWQLGSPLNMTLTELQMLWKARHGDKWVTEQEVRRDPFFLAAATRLHAAGQMERLTTSGAGLYDVFRIRGDDADR